MQRAVIKRDNITAVYRSHLGLNAIKYLSNTQQFISFCHKLINIRKILHCAVWGRLLHTLNVKTSLKYSQYIFAHLSPCASACAGMVCGGCSPKPLLITARARPQHGSCAGRRGAGPGYGVSSPRSGGARYHLHPAHRPGRCAQPPQLWRDRRECDT